MAKARIVGMRRFRRELKKLGADMKDLKAANAEAAKFIAGKAKPKSPRRTGKLAKSVRGNRSPSSAVIRVGNKTSVPYAGPIHWGWPRRNIKPQPWVRDTIISERPEWVPIYANAIQDIVDRIQGAPSV